ncbi:hypothetical protein SPAB_01231 [Salmonella enterica subsp. enterica serovar Paratyphi B str. SPB7]|uniref:Uncharacterized protein n=1 Tax=Salmonella paratyphi B (strain ATCC BAA-1250 / SPB7) TaxID=1016998 RepID=A0A6C6YZG5_SALPB|nr:hypothetical protein SPAB_01231 [Salmonella enterica subsp. enterica serovar Paratyphi B str. SPB7]
MGVAHNSLLDCKNMRLCFSFTLFIAFLQCANATLM